MEYLYVTCAGLLVFFSISLWTKKKKPLSELIYSWWILLLIVTVISFFIYSKGMSRTFPVFITLICDSHLLHGAFLYIYTIAFTNPLFRLKPVHLWHLAPMGFQIVAKLFLNYVFSAMECYEEGGCLEGDNIFVTLTFFYKYLVLGAYILATWRVIKRFMAGELTPRDQMRAEWVIQIAKGVTFLYFGVLLIQVGRYTIPDLFWDRMLLGNTLSTLFIFIFLYLGNSYAYLFVLPSKSRFKNLSESYQAPGGKQTPSKSDMGDIVKNLDLIMKKEQLFVKPQLTVRDIAEYTGIPATTISQAINSVTGNSFTDWVNRYRVDLLIKKLNDPANWNYKIMSLAAESGFISKTTLIRIFRQHTGTTPGEYLKKVQSEKGE